MQPVADGATFFVLQLIVIGAALFAATKDRGPHPGESELVVGRNETAMNRLYGIFATVVGVLVAIDLKIDGAEGYRITWILVDIAATAYLILFNVWFRNALHQLIQRLSAEIR